MIVLLLLPLLWFMESASSPVCERGPVIASERVYCEAQRERVLSAMR